MDPHAASPVSLAPPPIDRTTIRCTDPATGELLGDVPVMDRDEVVARLARARVAQEAWRTTSFAVRRRVVRRILDHVLEHSDELCRMISRDAGKTLENAAVELWPVCEAMRWNLGHAEKALRAQRVSSGLLMHKTATHRVPPARRHRRHLPVELPAAERARPGDPRDHGRQRGID
jgi:acyl-CoA reductase-like NAD-dependent aldehyde dehydrogenase